MSDLNPYWHGMLCRDTADSVTERMRRLLDGQHFTVVTCNSYDEASDRFLSVDVHTSQRLMRPIDTSDRDGYVGINWSTPRWVMGLHTAAVTQADGRAGRPHEYVHLTFEPGSVKIDHFAPAGYRLLWVLAVEHHDDEEAAS